MLAVATSVTAPRPVLGRLASQSMKRSTGGEMATT